MTPAGIEPATFRFVAQHLNPFRKTVQSFYHEGMLEYCLVPSPIGVGNRALSSAGTALLYTGSSFYLTVFVGQNNDRVYLYELHGWCEMPGIDVALPVYLAGKMSPVAVQILRILEHFSPPEPHSVSSGPEETPDSSREFQRISKSRLFLEQSKPCSLWNF